MAIRLVALDIDGTLSVANDHISERNQHAIRAAQKKGVFVTVATGRNYIATKPILDQLQVDGPAILYGGAWIADGRTGCVLHRSELLPETVRTVLDVAHAEGVHAQIYQGNAVLSEREHAFARRYCARFALPYTVDPALREKRHENVPKILVYVDPSIEDAVRRTLQERIGGIAGVSRSQPGFIEINSPLATKAQALSVVADRLGIGQAGCAALGDSYLDMDMIRWAGHGVCVADGVEAVKAIADIIVPACAADGVACYLEQYVL